MFGYGYEYEYHRNPTEEENLLLQKALRRDNEDDVEITIMISLDGTDFDLDIKGMKGKSCSALTSQVTEGIGIISNAQIKPEMFEETEQTKELEQVIEREVMRPRERPLGGAFAPRPRVHGSKRKDRSRRKSQERGEERERERE